nr:ComF family protein [uncultured Sphingorhabdus sp.]
MSDKPSMANIRQIFDVALNWALPERCPCCGVITSNGGPFCPGCWQQLEFIGPPYCASCGTPFAFDRGSDASCAACLSRPPKHNGIRAAVKYDDLSAQVALKLKYGGKVGLAKIIAMQLARHVPEERSNIIITPVPLHWTRIWSRTFNQSALIGRELALAANLEFVPDMLLRPKKTPSMRGLSPKSRRKAVVNAFAINPKWQGRLAGSRIILVDDVLTTGATTDGCVSVLKRQGADWVQIFCWARALRGEASDGIGFTLDA